MSGESTLTLSAPPRSKLWRHEIAALAQEFKKSPLKKSIVKMTVTTARLKIRFKMDPPFIKFMMAQSQDLKGVKMSDLSFGFNLRGDDVN